MDDSYAIGSSLDSTDTDWSQPVDLSADATSSGGTNAFDIALTDSAPVPGGTPVAPSG